MYIHVYTHTIQIHVCITARAASLHAGWHAYINAYLEATWHTYMNSYIYRYAHTHTDTHTHTSKISNIHKPLAHPSPSPTGGSAFGSFARFSACENRGPGTQSHHTKHSAGTRVSETVRHGRRRRHSVSQGLTRRRQRLWYTCRCICLS